MIDDRKADLAFPAFGLQYYFFAALGMLDCI